MRYVLKSTIYYALVALKSGRYLHFEVPTYSLFDDQNLADAEKEMQISLGATVLDNVVLFKTITITL